jgi:hypothetical protein
MPQEPGVRVVAILAPEWTARDKKRDPNARTVQARAGLVGMYVAERAFFVRIILCFGRIGRQVFAQIVAAPFGDLRLRLQTCVIRDYHGKSCG